MEYLPYIGLYLLIINALTFVIYGVDKFRAVKNRWRIPEATLIMLAVIGGSVGAALAMYVFRHKTMHALFFVGVPGILLFQLVIAVWLVLEMAATPMLVSNVGDM